METNFFSLFDELALKGDIQLTLKQGMERQWIVAVMLNNVQCGDDAKKLIPPMMLKGTAEELDKGFFKSIGTPLQSTSELLVNMEAFFKQLEEAKQQSAMEKEKGEKERKEKEGKLKKYNEAMQKVEELEQEGKNKEAWMKLPDPREFPEQAEALKKRRTELSNLFAPDLFGA